MDTTELVIYAQKGNQQAITALYNLSYKPAYAVAFKMTGNEDDAFDVLQDAYIKAFNSLDQLTDPSGFIPWFNKITANKCRDFLRSKKNVIMFSDMEYDNGEDSFELEFEDESTAFQPEERADYSDTKRLVAEMLDNLPADQKMVLLMYYVQEMSIKEIAEALDISENTVKSRMSYGKKKMRAQAEDMEKKGYKLRVSAVAIIPFLIWLLRNLSKEVTTPPMSAAIGSAAANASTAANTMWQAGRSASSWQSTQPSTAFNNGASAGVPQQPTTGYNNPPQTYAPQQPAAPTGTTAADVGKAVAKGTAKAVKKGVSVKAIIIIIAAAVGVIGGGIAFTGFALPAITGKPNFISNIINPGSKESTPAKVVEDFEKESTPAKVVEDFETAFNNNDIEAIKECFISEQAAMRKLQSGALIFLNEFISSYNDGKTMPIECELTDLKENGDTATGTVVITADLPIAGRRVLANEPAKFQKKDGKWYFSEF